MRQSVNLTIQDMFITRAWVYDLDLSAHHKAWMESIDKMRREDPIGGGERSVRHGYKGKFDLFENELFAPLYKQASACVEHALKEMGATKEFLSFYVEGSVNITDPGGYNRSHGHALNFLSGCYYLEVPPSSGAIEFHEPRLGAKYSPFQPKTLYGSNAVSIEPKAGQLALFPCWLEHSVKENQSNGARYSIPLNVKPRKSPR